MNECSIRTAEKSDLAGMLLLYRHLNPDDPASKMDAAEAAWAALMASDLVSVVIAEVAGVLVSSCTLVVVPNVTRDARAYGLIENVVTHSEHRRVGHGRAVLSVALDAAWKAGCYKVMLATGSRQAETLRFYEGTGFVRGGKTFFEARPSG